MTGNPLWVVVAKGELIPFRLRGTFPRDPQGKWPSYLLQRDPRSTLQHNSTLQGRFFLKYNGRPNASSEQFGATHTTKGQEGGDHRYQVARTMTDSASRSYGTRRRSLSQLEFLITKRIAILRASTMHDTITLRQHSGATEAYSISKTMGPPICARGSCVTHSEDLS
ncbi:hypothetical protein CRG98_048111 [Punica granatum]|uniref:Uncharacterized protein n=1 Tax=Punica granatum TaxID=22663 RepID=A0A2I0HII9_PUNGR|nr:hypothetical protein CRG98_048111 [Punica granatum]